MRNYITKVLRNEVVPGIPWLTSTKNTKSAGHWGSRVFNSLISVHLNRGRRNSVRFDSHSLSVTLYSHSLQPLGSYH